MAKPRFRSEYCLYTGFPARLALADKRPSGSFAEVDVVLFTEACPVSQWSVGKEPSPIRDLILVLAQESLPLALSPFHSGYLPRIVSGDERRKNNPETSVAGRCSQPDSQRR